jgi:hypothetical protein
MEYARVAAIVLALAINFSPRCEAEQYASPAQQKTTDEGQSSVAVVNDIGRANEANHAQEKSPYWDKAPEWMLVFVGLITFVAVWYQARETKRAAEATQKAAEATLLNAQALVASERPWIMIEWEAMSDGIYRGYSFKAVNRGKSPAEVTNRWFQWDVLKSSEDIENLPDFPRYRTIETERDRLVHSEWIAPGESRLLYNFSSISDFRDSEPDWKDVLEGRKLLACKGFVRYNDTLGSASHVTRFCFLVVSEALGTMKMIGPNPRYNEHT